jgi:hypothetical protein
MHVTHYRTLPITIVELRKRATAIYWGSSGRRFKSCQPDTVSPTLSARHLSARPLSARPVSARPARPGNFGLDLRQSVSVGLVMQLFGNVGNVGTMLGPCWDQNVGTRSPACLGPHRSLPAAVPSLAAGQVGSDLQNRSCDCKFHALWPDVSPCATARRASATST